MRHQALQLFIILLALAACSGHLASKRLYEDLLSDYNRLIRPVLNNNDTVYVNLSLKLTQLLEINMKQQVMSTNVSNRVYCWSQFVTRHGVTVRSIQASNRPFSHLIRFGSSKTGSIFSCSGIRKSTTTSK